MNRRGLLLGVAPFAIAGGVVCAWFLSQPADRPQSHSAPMRLLADVTPRCTKHIKVQAPPNQTRVEVVSDGEHAEPIAITRRDDGQFELWTIVVDAQCESPTRSFSVQFFPSGRSYAEASAAITVTDAPTRRRPSRQ